MRVFALVAVVLIVVSLLMSACGGASTPGSTSQVDATNLPEIVSVSQTKALLSNPNVVILDVREQQEYDQSHIAGVRLIPTGDLPNRLAEIPRDKTVIVTCRSGNRSAAATKFLREQGYTDVHNMEGGIIAWQAAGYPVEK